MPFNFNHFSYCVVLSKQVRALQRRQTEKRRHKNNAWRGRLELRNGKDDRHAQNETEPIGIHSVCHPVSKDAWIRRAGSGF